MMQWLSFISVLLIPIRGAKQWSILWGWPHAPILTFGDSITEWMANFDIAYAQRSWRKSVKLFWEIHGRPACLKSFQAKIKTDTCEISPLWFLFGNTRRFWWASFLLPVFSDPPVGNKENMRSSVPDRLETKSFIFLSKKCTKALGPETMGMVVFGCSLIQVSLIAWFGSPLMRLRRTRYEQYPHIHQAEHFIRPLALHVIQWTYPYFQKSLPKGLLYIKSHIS